MTANTSLDDFCPLNLSSENAHGILAEARKRAVLNVIESYSSYWDLLSELAQNAMDATSLRGRSDSNYKPVIYVEIDYGRNTILFAENGCGMNEETFRYFAVPDATTKSKDRALRGNKGVGATFLTYAFEEIRIHTKSACGFSVKSSLAAGRKWAENEESTLSNSPNMKSYEGSIADDFLSTHSSGTAIFIDIGNNRPRLSYCKLTSASSWLTALQTKTAFGQVNISSDADGLTVSPDLHIKVLNNGEVVEGGDDVFLNKAHYLLPHEMYDADGQIYTSSDIRDMDRDFAECGGDEANRRAKYPKHFNLDMVHSTWTSDEIINDEKFNLRDATPEIPGDDDLIKRFKISMYGCFCATADTYKKFNETVGIHSNQHLLKGGLQLCTSLMPQGSLLEIPLKRYIGYQRNAHVIIHFRDAAPDLGRKGFQPQLQNLAERLAKDFIDRIREGYKGYLAERSGRTLKNRQDVDEWLTQSKQNAENHPLPPRLSNNGTEVALGSIGHPMSEQDVVVLFPQLVSSGLLPGLKLLAASENKTYDAIMRVNFDDTSVAFSSKNKVGLDPEEVSNVEGHKDYVVEYKLNFNSVLNDFDKEKDPATIDAVVCWQNEGDLSGGITLQELRPEDRGRGRLILPGSTHIARNSGADLFEVVVLKTLIAQLAI